MHSRLQDSESVMTTVSPCQKTPRKSYHISTFVSAPFDHVPQKVPNFESFIAFLTDTTTVPIPEVPAASPSASSGAEPPIVVSASDPHSHQPPPPELPQPLPVYDIPSTVFSPTRKRRAHWTAGEDERLVAALEIGRRLPPFVGHRTHAQCSQRWHRGLNPSLSKTN
jgi:hypothetical protein